MDSEKIGAIEVTYLLLLFIGENLPTCIREGVNKAHGF